MPVQKFMVKTLSDSNSKNGSITVFNAFCLKIRTQHETIPEEAKSTLDIIDEVMSAINILALVLGLVTLNFIRLENLINQSY